MDNRGLSHMPSLSLPAYWFGKQSVTKYIAASGKLVTEFDNKTVKKYITKYHKILNNPMDVSANLTGTISSVSRFDIRALPLSAIGLVYILSLSNHNNLSW